LRRSRGTIAVDKELLESIKSVANSKGVPLSNYLRTLLSEAITIEKLGHHAPRALSEKRVEYFLENLGFVLLPREALKSVDLSTAQSIGRKIGLLLKEVGVDPALLIEYLSKYVENVVIDSNKLILIQSTEPTSRAMIEIIKEVAKTSNIKVMTQEGVIVVDLPKEKYSRELEAFDTTKSKK